MPVTAKFSKEFYDKLGHPVADEIVDWFNQVDAAYRTDLRELNELNFARFDAKLEQRLAEQDAKWERRIATLDAKWEQRFVAQDAKWEQRIATLDAKWERRVDDLRVEMRTGLAELRVESAKQKAEMIKWMFGFWAPTAVGVIALLLK